MPATPLYPLVNEILYGAHPRACRRPHVLGIGTGICLGAAPYLKDQARRRGIPDLQLVAADAGPFDLTNHLAHAPGFSRHRVIAAGTQRVGGLLSLWGMSTPRVPPALLCQWPYDFADLQRRFKEVEDEMGVPDPIPLSGRDLEFRLRSQFRDRFGDVDVAPLAIDRDGRRWTPLAQVPQLVAGGMRLLPRFRCTQLLRDGARIVGVRGTWHDGRSYTLHPEFLVLGVGVEASLPLLRQVVDGPLPLEASDHMRIDLHGRLPAGTFGPGDVEQLGVAVLIMQRAGGERSVPYHLEIKVAPRGLWARGLMQSADNLKNQDDSDDTIYVQVQAVAAMHDRLPTSDLLQVNAALPPVMSARDAAFHGEIIGVMREVAAALGLAEPTFNLRPLLTNHHVYGAYRVGRAVSKEFRFQGIDNLYVLPPSAYVDLDDDANPTLKSRVLAQYAMDDIVDRLAEAEAVRNGELCGFGL